MTFKEYIKRHSRGRRVAFTGNDDQLRAGRRVNVRDTTGKVMSFLVRRSIKERRQCLLPKGGRFVAATDKRIALFLPDRKVYRLEVFKDGRHLLNWIMRYWRRLALANQLNDHQKLFIYECIESDD